MYRTTINTIIHSFLPLGYVVGLILFGDVAVAELVPFEGTLWPLLLLAILISTYSIKNIFKYLHLNHFEEHSIAKILSSYIVPPEISWSEVASRINAEYHSEDKFECGGGITRTIVLRSWLIHTEYYDVQFIHIPDAKLKVVGSAEHRVSHIDSTGLQSLTILVECRRFIVPSFTIQVNSLDYDHLKQRLPLENSKNIPIHRNLSDRFIEAFKSHVMQNPTLETSEELEMCIGCMQEEADVALRKLCDDDPTMIISRCTGCLCRPLWCSSCLARWFAARQDQDSPHTWLNGKCPCPTCRSTFCLLDVQPLISTRSSSS